MATFLSFFFVFFFLDCGQLQIGQFESITLKQRGEDSTPFNFLASWFVYILAALERSGFEYWNAPNIRLKKPEADGISF